MLGREHPMCIASGAGNDYDRGQLNAAPPGGFKYHCRLCRQTLREEHFDPEDTAGAANASIVCLACQER